MANIYFKETKSLAGDYLKLVRVRNVKPEERNGLSIILQEYQIASGDIGEPEQARALMARLRVELEDDGHILHRL